VATRSESELDDVPPERAESAVMAALREAGELTTFSGASLKALPSALTYISETLRQAWIMIRGTTLLLVAMQMFLAMTAVNVLYFILIALGATDYMGLAGYAAPRQLVTTMFGFVFTGKVCSSMTAEIGAMRVNQEIEALDSVGVDPFRYVVATRITAALIFVPFATAISLLACYFGLYLESITILHGLAPASLSQVYWGIQATTDQIFCLVTVGVIALVTTVVACFYGLRTRGGPAAVGDAVARSVVVNLVLGLMIASTFAAGFYGTNLRTPIGGG
jgi:phospholipid/cholesterol/gamma-HCH transport system permease protein